MTAALRRPAAYLSKAVNRSIHSHGNLINPTVSAGYGRLYVAMSMRKLTLTLNVLCTVLFLAFFTYTFVARSHLESIARDFVTEKTVEHSGPIIDTLEKTLDLPLVEKLASKDDINLVRTEIAEYRKGPATYIADLTGKQIQEPQGELGAIAQKVANAKKAIRQFYNDLLSALIVDLRIFSGTNIVAACIALFLALKSSYAIRKPLIVFSFLLFVAVVYSSYLYIDDLSFFRILMSAHLGWFYPVSVTIFAFMLYKDYGAVIQAAAFEDKDS